MLQRKTGNLGASLGKTTCPILKTRRCDAGVEMVSGATYTGIDDRGLRYSVDAHWNCCPPIKL
jgi:2,4-dienoyl-CoA reductase (NADPH2)